MWESCIRDWCKNKSKLQPMPGKSLHIPGGGREDMFLSCDELEENETVIDDN